MKAEKKTGQNDLSSALARYQGILSPERYARLQAISSEPAPSAVRINRLKVEAPAGFIQGLAAKYGWKIRALPFSENAWIVEEAATPPSKTKEHQLGYFYLQDAASVLPVSLFDPQLKPSLTLDMAASPGGKTTQLVDLVMDAGLTIANDSSASRLPALRAVTETWSAFNLAITNYPGESWGAWYPNSFDRILLDAPCSMESLRDSPSHPHRPISQDERLRLASRQLGLLASALAALKPGGELVYSTCSLAPEEDEFVLDSLIERYPGAFTIEQEKTQHYQTPGLTGFEGRQLHPELVGALRVWPDSFGTNGFFAAKLTKTAAIEFGAESPPSRPFDKTGLTPITPSSLQALADEFMRDYAFPLVETMTALQLRAFQRGQEVNLIPEAWLSNFAALPFYKLGTCIAKQTKTGFEASPEFILRFGNSFSTGFIVLDEAEEAQWLKGLEIRGYEAPEGLVGKILAVRSKAGLNLGAAKANPGRLRNLLPRSHLKLY